MNPSAIVTSDAVSESGFAVILEEVASKCLAGEHIDWSAYQRDYPQHVEELRQLLPAMRAVADLSRSARDGDGASTPGDGVTGTLGDFRILSELGRGGMGVVYEAEQISLGRRVALKVLPFASTLDAKQLQRFKNEAQAAASLHHTNIVPVHATGCERGVHYYAMQFIEGQTLAEIIADLRLQNVDLRKKRGAGAEPKSVAQAEAKSVAGAEVLRSPGELTVDSPANAGASEYLSPGHPASNLKSTICNLKSSTFPSTQGRTFYHAIARLGIQAAEALDYSHELGVIHRDIKPANMLVDGRGNLWITDFGLAHCQNQAGLTMSGDLVGTLRYMSPEQALAKRVVVDHRTDIYSLGATLYELLTLEPVFAGADRQELLRQIAFEEPKAPRHHNKSIPAELETIVLKALEKNPADRYATAKELAEDLERFGKDEPIRARRPSLRRRVKQWCRRHKPLVNGAVALVLTALFLGSAVLWSQERRRAATEQAVMLDLHDADTWQKQEQWAKVSPALERAAARLEGSGLDVLQAEVNKRRRDVALVPVLEQNCLQVSGFAWFFRGSPDYEFLDRVFTKAFADYGLDVAALTPEETANRVRASAIKGQLIFALDHWARVKDQLSGANKAGTPLRTIVRLADDDPWRRQLRNAREAKDLALLMHRSEAQDVLTQPPSNLVLLFHLLQPNQTYPGEAKDRATQKKAEETGMQLLRRAQRRYPADFWINMMCAHHFSHKENKVNGKTTFINYAEALGFLRAALVVQPENPDVNFALGLWHLALRNLADAEAAFYRTIELTRAPAHARIHSMAHGRLGEVLYDQRRLPEAEWYYRKLLELQPGDFKGAYMELGKVLRDQHKLPEAEEAYRKYIELMKPRDGKAHHQLALVLREQGRLADAEASVREAIRLGSTTKDDLAWSYLVLGDILAEQHKLPDGIAAMRKALSIKPDYTVAYFDLGLALHDQNNLPGAITSYRKAIALSPDYALAYCELALALQHQGRFAEALAEIKKGHELGSAQPNWRRPSARWVREAQRLAEVDAMLPSVLNGKFRPADAAEQLALAKLCQLQCRRLYAASERFFRAAFAGEPKLAHDLGSGNRYDAACAAALAGTGQGKDGAALEPGEQARLRQQALAWLRADLTARQADLQKDADKARLVVRRQMKHWQQDPDFNGVRGETALAKLPDAERREWQKLWEVVAELERRAAAGPAAKAK